ncbi:MAG TPA: triple tyrosine motif-containing protein [Puia sp.]|jgi:ligand-binding sensor domain-containing protein/DNA-binding CsgD family transcriptional regulator
MKKLIVAFFLCVAVTKPGQGQSTIGLPAIKNYHNTDYHAALGIWDICQDQHGLLYFANNDGLLTYDGAYWKLYPLPNKAAIKSLAMDAKGRIFVGGQDEIGYFFPDAAGILQYHSLKEQLPREAQQFADIWNIIPVKDGVFFRTIESIFYWKDNKITTFDAPGGWQLLAQVDSLLFAADKSKGLQVFRNGQWQPAVGNLPSPALRITGIAAWSTDTLLVSTLKNGLYLLSGSNLIRKPTGADPLLTSNLITTIKKIEKDRYAIGTSTGGLLVLDRTGEVVQRYSSGEGLQSNNVLSVRADRESNLWLGLETGISFVHYNTSVKQIRPVRDNQLLCNAIRVYDQKLYIGTSNGLYRIGLEPSIKDISKIKGNFSEVENTKGRVWSLTEIEGKLLMGHQDGAYVIKNDRAIPVLTRQGVWGFVKTPAEIIAGTYTGLRGITIEKGELKEGQKINDLYESLPEIVVDSAFRIWASHPYRGVFKNPVSNTGEIALPYAHYGIKEGLPSNLNNSVHIIHNKVVIATEKGVYEYDAGADRFIPSAFFQPVFHDTSVEDLTSDADGNIWFVSSQRVGVIDFSKPSGSTPYSIIYFPELTDQTVKGFAFIYPYDRENIFIGGNNGVFHLNYSRYIQGGNDLTVMLSTVKAIAEKDSLIFGGYAGDGDPATPVRLPNHWNSFHFEYSSPFYAQQANVEFSYQLTGFDKEWSEWTPRTEKDYTNLSYGKYSFSVRARDNLGNVSAPVAYTFSVRPAWYQTTWAWLLYLFLLGWLVYLVGRAQQRRLALHQKKYEEQQERRNYLYSLELDRKEKGLIALQNSKLEGELQFKNKELATVTMHLVERGGIMLSIKEELLAVIKRLNIPSLSYEFRSVFRMISDTEKSDDDWNRFALYFDQVHNNFLATLKTRFPQLSPTDLKLCAYLRLNLTSKEIAQILNISLKGVEVSRYRLRKKLNLSTEVNLYDFLIEVTS